MTSIRTLVAATGLAVSLLAAAPPARAETPATALDVSVYYLDVDAVVAATEVGLVPDVGEALSDAEVSHGARLAILDALGWSVSGSTNAARYLDFLAAARDTHVRDLRLEDLSAAEALSLGYLVARDQPADTSAALSVDGALDGVTAAALLERAAGQAPASYTVALVRALVAATAEASSRCAASTTISAVVERHEGERDLRPEADEMVRDLLASYADACD